MKEAFLSYAHEDKARAGRVKQILEENGVTAFLAHETLEVSTEWRAEILRHLETSSALVALVTNNFAKSMWANQEVGVAFARRLVLIPLMFDRTSELKGFLEMFQGVHVTEDDLVGKVKSVVPRIIEGKSPGERSEEASETRILWYLKSKVDSYLRLLKGSQRRFEKLILDETTLDSIAVNFPALVSLMTDFRGMTGELNDLVDSYVRIAESNIDFLQMPDRHSTLSALLGDEDLEQLKKSRRLKQWAKDQAVLIDMKRKKLLELVEELDVSLDRALGLQPSRFESLSQSP